MSSFYDRLNHVEDSGGKPSAKFQRRLYTKWSNSLPSDESQMDKLMDPLGNSDVADLTDSDSKETIYITANNSVNTIDGKVAKLSEIPVINECHQLSTETSKKLLLDVKESENRFSENTFVRHDVEGTSELELVRFGIKLSLQDVSNADLNVLMTDFIVTKMITNPQFKKVNFKFIAYAPVAFRFFRETFGIDTKDFIRSICDQPFLQIPSFSKKSTKVYMTMDSQFIVKTCSKKEADFLKVLFPGYFLNFTQHPESLLPKYFGLFSYTKGIKKVLLLIMNNLLPTSVNFQDMYYLKGSTYSNRHTGIRGGEYESYIAYSGTNSLKDLDFLERCPDGYYLEEETYERLMKSISRDCKMLSSCRIMNYCLVLGVCTPSINLKDQDCTLDDKNPCQIAATAQGSNIENSLRHFVAFTSKEEKIYLYLGFVNILQNYSFKRKFEYLAKSVVYKSSTVSINSPEIYSIRFQNFLKSSVLKCRH